VAFRQRRHDDLARFGRRYPTYLLNLHCCFDVVILHMQQEDISDEHMIRLAGRWRLKLFQTATVPRLRTRGVRRHCARGGQPIF
jgi:hypothetical protein